ncbi:MAG: YdcF family protein [Eubacterium sp.]|nr:YdcF family protein [Eubacterium sp.]
MKFILLSLGFILLLWYLAPLAAGIFNVGNALGIVGSVLMILFGFYCDKIPAGFKYGVFTFVALMLAVIVIPFSFNLVKYSEYKTDEGAQTVIVLGCKVNGTVPSKYLYDRCKAAAEYLNENPDAVAILSGGQGSDEAISEAQCMENVLTDMGIDKSRLYKEDKSTNTMENIAFSGKIIEENGLSTEVVIVTNEFHEYRAKLFCDRVGLSFHSHCSHSSLYTFLTYYTRELLGIVKEHVFPSEVPA